MYFYSKSTGGFYNIDINGTNMPSDVVEITDNYYNELLEKQGLGYAIVANSDGYPENESELPAPTADQNKAIASEKLYKTDWTTILDVSDPTKSNPYLLNVDEFLAYRNTIRQIAVNPVAGNIEWEIVPTAQWST